MLGYNSLTHSFTLNNQPIHFSPEDLNEMDSYQWWHRIRFSPEVASPGNAEGARFISHYLLDTIDFTGKSVLDIGCWDGFQLFYAEARGASRVVGVDDISQRHMGDRAREFAKRKLNSKVEFINMNVYNLSTENIGSFDIVMMFGVLYHLVHPMLGVEKACGVCKDEFLLSTHYLETEQTLEEESPLCILYPGTELSNDHTNWSGPTKSWIYHALRIQSFETKTMHTYDNDRITFHASRTANEHKANSLLNSHRDLGILGKK